MVSDRRVISDWMVQSLIVLLLQGHSGTGEVQDNHHSLLQRSHGKIRLLLLSFFLLDSQCVCHTDVFNGSSRNKLHDQCDVS